MKSSNGNKMLMNNTNQFPLDLIVFAHFQEGQSFIEYFAMTPVKLNLPPRVSLSLFVSEKNNKLVAVVGEGVQNAGNHLAFLLGYFWHNNIKLSCIYNIGVAASLNPKLALGECHWIKNVLWQQGHAKNGLDLIFNSFYSDQKNGLTCITNNHRVKNEQDCSSLLAVGELLDRELWAVANLAHLYGLPWQGLKLISDSPLFATTHENICQLVLEQAKDYSKNLLNYFLKEVSKNEGRVTEVNNLENLVLERFYFTESMKRTLLSLFRELKNVLPINQDYQSFLAKTIEDTASLNCGPKEKGQQLIQLIQNKISPHEAKLKEELKNLQGKNLNLEWSKDYEKIMLRSEISSIDEIQNIILEIENLKQSKIPKLLDGSVFE